MFPVGLVGTLGAAGKLVSCAKHHEAQRLGARRECVDWFTVHVRRGCEQETAQRLTRGFGVTTYCPEVRQRQGCEIAAGPLFPGYFFVQDPCCGETLRGIECTPGCGTLLRRPRAPGERSCPPATMPAAEIEWLQCRLAAVDRTGGSSPPVRQPCKQIPSAVLPPAEGASCGLEEALNGPLSPAARVAVLLRVLGCQRPADQEEDEEPAVKRLRRTRGHGRRIHYR